MENDNDKRIDEWFSLIGVEKFKKINTAIEDLLARLYEITHHDEFVATVEAKAVELAAGIITKDFFSNSVTSELSQCNINSEQRGTILSAIQNVLPEIIQSTESKEYIPEKNSTVAPVSVFTGIQKNLTEARKIAPITREHATIKTEAANSSVTPPKGIKSIDPYRELPL